MIVKGVTCSSARKRAGAIGTAALHRKIDCVPFRSPLGSQQQARRAGHTLTTRTRSSESKAPPDELVIVCGALFFRPTAGPPPVNCSTSTGRTHDPAR
jgi:hypothetical protein